MSRLKVHHEHHQLGRIGWMRAAVLGANDGIVSTASLIIGVAAASAGQGEILVAGVAALVAGSMSMAAGEYVSVSSQSDAEQAELAKERQELIDLPEAEHAELAGIYEERGLKPETAKEVAHQLMADDPLRAHARDELGITDLTAAKPIQAAISSAISFAVGAALPLALVWLVPLGALVTAEAVASLLFLALLGAVGARAGGASIWRPMLRVTFWGALAMAITAGIGHLVGAVI
ncbi:VIT1/CCC1 transporter family protein [Hyphomonas johnsonii]|jgi:VIT1/CCC1 family predicted Fe2+/Mn2+ transporter|uniref:Nodulin-like protein n=1 Tax=Hyphomonas johnsonii MHS-2 TaxID=1280950 RepID=A0A059FUN0_9PROT|nr:VIT family protein [Hyphomonas johnsonii]KCZ94317.1 nodulin-like protein [Hyphomonas johnsonii MHS-2]